MSDSEERTHPTRCASSASASVSTTAGSPPVSTRRWSAASTTPEIFAEVTTQDSVSLEEGIVKSGDRHLEQGVGVRALAGEKQGYAHADDVTVESVRLAAATARAISERSRQPAARSRCGAARPRAISTRSTHSPTDVPVARKVELLGEIDVYARGLDPRVKQVMASVVSQHRQVLIAASDGTLCADVQPAGAPQRAGGGGGRRPARGRLPGNGRPLPARAPAGSRRLAPAGRRGGARWRP